MRRRLLAAGFAVKAAALDTKTKELVGDYRNAGSDWRPKGDPERVKAHDFEDKKLGKVAPYGVYDIAADAGFCQPRRHLRHGRVRGRRHSRVARKDRPDALSEGGRADDQGGLRRLERRTGAACGKWNCGAR